MTSYTKFNNEFLFFLDVLVGLPLFQIPFHNNIALIWKEHSPLAVRIQIQAYLSFSSLCLIWLHQGIFFSLSDCRDGTGKSRATAQINPNLRTSNPFKFSHIDTVVGVLVFFSYPLFWKSAWLSKIWVSTPLLFIWMK